VPRYSDEAPLIQQPRKNNGLILGSTEIEDEEKEDTFLRSGGMGAPMSGFGMPKQRNLSPLIEEESDDKYLDMNSNYNQKKLLNKAWGAPNLTTARRMSILDEDDQGVIDMMRDKSGQQAGAGVSQGDLAWSLGLPKLQQQKRNRDARRIYNTAMHNKASANPWTKTGQQTEANVQNMFGERAARIPGFEKLFGGPASNFRSKERAGREQAELDATGQAVFDANGRKEGMVKKKGIGAAFTRFFWRMKNRFRGNANVDDDVSTREKIIGPKMPWMQRLFGAHKKGGYASEMGIKSKFKPMGVSSGWADQLVNQSEGAGLGEGAENFAGEGQQEQDADQKDAYQSAQPISEEDKGPKVAAHESVSSEESEEVKKPVGNQLQMGFFQKALENQRMLAAAHQSNEYGNPQANEYGDDGTVDDNSIDNDEDEGQDPYGKMQAMAYMQGGKDDDSEEEDEGLNNQDKFRQFLFSQLGGYKQ
jgi:hypothetical protein